MVRQVDERDWPDELDGLIEAVLTADEPYQAALAVTACAADFMAESAVASGVYLVWAALGDRYELRPESDDAHTFAVMRRAAAEWAAVTDDVKGRATYLDHWQYEELGYQRLVPKGWRLQMEERPDGTFRAQAESPEGKAIHATAPSWFDLQDEIRRKSFAVEGH